MSDTAENDESAKTEDPTPRKLEESRRRGQVAVSRELNTWLLLIAGTVIIAAIFPALFLSLGKTMEGFIAHAHQLPGGVGGAGIVLSSLTWTVLKTLALPFLVLMVAAIAGPLLQAGPIFAPELLKPDLQKISPVKGFERLFSRRALLEFVKGVVKLTVVTVVTYFVLSPYLPAMDHLVGLPFSALLDELLTLTIKFLIAVIVALMVFAGLDVAYQRFDLYKRLRMTKQEVKDEFRQTEGDPLVRGRLKQLRLERARQRMIQNVPKADVVITNPTHYSVALQYVPGEMLAPKVLAKGVDAVAFRIREVATAHDIEIVENPPLARALYDTVEIDDIIPQDLYKAVAEVITYVFKKNGKARSL